MIPEIADILVAAERGQRFAITEASLDDETALQFVQLKHNPVRFTPQVFTGEWAILDSHPKADAIRLLATVICEDGSIRLIGRQGSKLYALSREKRVTRNSRKAKS
jgi:hypothetical protein